MKKPICLNVGDTVAFISPSSGCGAVFPHRINRAARWFETQGFRVKLLTTCFSRVGLSAGTVSDRLSDLHNAFADQEVKAIICNIGGLTANELLLGIDFELIANNPKIFCGFSDITLLHQAILKKSELVTFYGPATMTQWAEYPEPQRYTIESFLRTVCCTAPVGQLDAASEWSDEVLEWGTDDLKRPRRFYASEGWVWLRNGYACGLLTGGCLPSLLQLMGTPFEPEFDGRILLLETPEGDCLGKGPSLQTVHKQLSDLKSWGVFERISGLVVGRPFGYSYQEQIEFRQLIEEHVNALSLPVLYNADFGHCDPILTIPLGVDSTLDSSKGVWSIEESAVQSSNIEMC